ncbi:organic solvents resistance ABC transporter periplasmic protein [Melioribacter roseus P3M-2]|uniref:Organic solvents resistance ABC transporter periplasmic protein n=1 Tax=Melioribacter roseus (strain DSM 23840 / JCM 17771 / VKM B-2668 / P3M-2) TaxID=1191523 RepID=I7A3J2_MELRP|nr:MlaD family protein [Melioribacter roseus]AFN75788.1 organic solvents resistance ABC transporter periplasmic protein [Melioribacter roseus P3M-2]
MKMRDERKTEIKVGITVFLALIVFLWILGWAKNITFNSDKTELKIKFDNVAGLEIGDPVTVNGVRSGYVDDIRTENDYVVAVLKIDKETSLRRDATFQIMMLDLMGGKKVEIYPGNSDKPLDPNQIYEGLFLGDISTTMALLGNLQSDLISLVKEVNVTLAKLNNTVLDDSFTDKMKGLVSNLNHAAVNLNSFVARNDSNFSRLISNSIEITDNVNALVSENRDSVKVFINSANSTLYESKKLLSELNALLDETKRSENNLGRLLYDDKFMNDLKDTMTKLNKLVEILEKQIQGEGIKVDANIF